MEWSYYKVEFQNICKKKEIPDEQVRKWLSYAYRLNSAGLPIIYDTKHLSCLLGYKLDLLRNICYSQEKYYRTFSIPKKNGDKRIIKEPYPSLKEIQKWILNNIIKKISVSNFAKAYVPKRSVIDNAKFHRNHKVVMKFDIEDFFGSIKHKDIFRIFRKLGYSKELSIIFAGLCCLDNKLPQGAPTSPYLSNIFAEGIDTRLSNYLKSFNFYYTRYSDDITISGDIKDEQIFKIMSFCKYLTKCYGLNLNEAKTKILREQHKQYITGVIVNKKISADSRQKKDIRQQIYYIKKYGLEDHINYKGIKQQNYLYHLMGKIQWILFLENENKEFLEYHRFLKQIMGYSAD